MSERMNGSGMTMTRRATSCGLLLALAGLGGCETDSFFDPSVVGRWENTPTVMPILDRLSAIEDEPADMVRSEPIRPEDLIPEVEQYRFGPGDVLEVVIRDFINPGVEEKFQQNVDSRGYLYIPKLKPIRAQGRTNVELVDEIKGSVEEAQLRAAKDTVASINILSQRSQTFSVLGAVAAPQEYFISQPNFRLLQALTAAGGFSETIEKIYVIRQVPLSDEAAGITIDRSTDDGVKSWPDAAEPMPAQDPNKLLDLINELSTPKSSEPKPGMMRGVNAANGRRGQPEAKSEGRSEGRMDAPPIDLPGPKGSASSPARGSGNGTNPPESEWVYENGQWVRRGPTNSRADGGKGSMGSAGGGSGPVVTQRVIEVPVDRLIAGDASVNVVVRPGDVIRVPAPKTGVVYLGGQVSRPGPYSLTGDTRLTILRGMISAGGLGSLAIPERVDITRVIGPGRQATIRLNMKAIGEQTQPDIYLKPDDMINVGTNFWALPLAVVRGGFRASYGYGFILDRNFGGEVFGADRSLNR